MSRYLIIESRDPFDSNDVLQNYELAQGLARQGSNVTVFLVQNGVMPARRGSMTHHLDALAKAGVEVLADEFSLRERGIGENKIAASVSSRPLDVVIDHMVDGSKVIWH